MKKSDIVRAWRDEEFRLSLTEEQRAQLPESPAGILDIAEENLRSAAGGGSGPCFCPDEATCC